MDKKINFEVNDFQIVEEESNSQFATFECDICRSGNNTHRLVISKEAIHNSAHSAKGKPILASFRMDKQDFRGHDADEVPIGFTSDDLEPEIVERDGEDYIRVKGKIWKRYFEDAISILKKKDGKTEVSMEMLVLRGMEPTLTTDGSVDLFSIQAITVLGVPPSIKGSELRVLSFAEMLDEYHKESQSELEKFSEERRKSMAKSYKINKTELKTTPWGDVDKTAMRNKIIEASNRNTLVKNVYALVEEGWQDAPSQHLKYPLMQLVGDTFYYNRGALSSALAYAKQENEQSVISKVESLYRKFKLDMEDGESENMAEEIKNKEQEMAEDIIENANEPTEEEMAEKNAEQEQEEEKMAEEPADEKKDDDVEDGKEDDDESEDFSVEQPNFAKDLMQIMECATADERMACRELMQYEDEDMNIVMDRVCAACDKMAELEEFKASTLKAQTEVGVSEILASVQASLSQEDFAELEKMSADVTFEELDVFNTKAKAFAFEHMSAESKKAQDDGIIRMGLGDIDAQDKTTKNVFERILSR